MRIPALTLLLAPLTQLAPLVSLVPLVPLATLATLATLTPALARAQGVTPRATCNGEVVSAIDYRSFRPGSSIVEDVWKTATDFAGLTYVPTRPEVVAAYLRVAVGKRCTELDLSESERLLRAQSFIASARVNPVPDGPGRVRIVVETVDNFPLIVGGSFQGAIFESVLLGTQNLAGRGLTVEVSGARGFGYRPGFGGDVIQYGAFGRPFTLAVGGERDPLGDALRFELSKPFLTDEQPNAFHIGANELDNYYDITRPIGDDVFLNVRRVTYDVGVGTRVARLGRSGAVGVLGAALLGLHVNTASQAVFMTDSAGLVPAPGLPEVDGRFGNFGAVRAGVFAGVRALKFTTVRGFDVLTGRQDIGSGVQVGLFAGPSIWASQSERDFFMSGELYAGIGNPSSFVEFRVTGEGSSDWLTHRWSGLVGSSKAVWYVKPNDDETRIATLELSAVKQLGFPLQLSFWDHVGGLPGFPNARTVGGERAILRLEERRVVRILTKRADWAVAGFADVGRIWAGDVPYGSTSPVRASVGVSLLSAYPAGGTRTYRVDLAIPVNPDGAKFELRFTSGDNTRSLWRQPNDLAVASTAGALSNLGSWTPR